MESQKRWIHHIIVARYYMEVEESKTPLNGERFFKYGHEAYISEAKIPYKLNSHSKLQQERIGTRKFNFNGDGSRIKPATLRSTQRATLLGFVKSSFAFLFPSCNLSSHSAGVEMRFRTKMSFCHEWNLRNIARLKIFVCWRKSWARHFISAMLFSTC